MAEQALPRGSRARRLRSAVLAATALALLLTACGGEARGGGDAGERAAAAGADASATATPAAAETLGIDEHVEALLTPDVLPGHRRRGQVDLQVVLASAVRTDAPACKPIADANVALFFTHDPAGGVGRQPTAVIDAQMAKLP